MVLTSVGVGGASHLAVLRQLTPRPDAKLAEMLLQAPTQLITLDDRAGAMEVCELLEQGGLEAAVLAAGDDFEPGTGEYDIALHVRDIDQVNIVVAHVVALLGVSANEAREIVCASPPVLIGNVSRATVDALRLRFAAAGAEISVSRKVDARFDLVVASCAPRVRSHLVATMEVAGFEVTDHDAAPLVVLDLDRATAESALAELSRASSDAKVIDRAFERFDVRVVACPNTPDVVESLIELTGMPSDVAERIADNTPIVLLEEVDRPTMENALLRLATVGATAVAELTTLAHSAVRVDSCSDLAAASNVVASLTGSADADMRPITKMPHMFSGSFSRVRANWIVHELRQLGATAEVLVP